MELGIYAFGDLNADPHTGQSQSIGERLEGIIQLGGGHLYVGQTSQSARSDFFPYYAGYWQNNSARFTSAFPKETFEEWTSPDGPMLIGSPQQVIDKLMKHHELLGISRFIGQIDVGSMPSGMAQDSLELFATEVAPVLRKEAASSSKR